MSNIKLRIIIFGLGEAYKKQKKYLEETFNIVGYSDNQVIMDCEKYIAPTEIINSEYDYIYITSREYFDEISYQLQTKYSVNNYKIIGRICKETQFIIENDLQNEGMGVSKKCSTWISDIGLLNTVYLLNDKQKKSFMNKYNSGEIYKEIFIEGGEKYKDKIFYVIRRDIRDVGLFSMYITNAGRIAYALERGYVPVVDMRNCRNCYHNKHNVGMVNTWELFFEQPFGYTLEEAYQAKNLILSDLRVLDERPKDSRSYFENEGGILNKWRDIALQYMIPKKEIIEEANKRYEKLINENDNVLGVAIRGTDYVSLRPPGHPIQPTVEQAIKDAYEMLEKYQCTKVFLCTEDKKIVKTFKAEFGEKLIENKRELIDYQEGLIMDNLQAEDAEERYLSGKEYLITILMLAQTDYLLASRTSGTVGVEMISTGWKSQQIYCLGRYPKE